MDRSYTQRHSEEPSEALRSQPCCLGIDEAGRGPVLGPMVYGVAYCPLTRKDDLKSLGVDDSKKLTEEQRDAQLEGIRSKSEWLGWTGYLPRNAPKVINLTTLVSDSLLKRNKYNLNDISHDTAILLIRDTLKQGVDLAEIYVDTVGPPEKYQDKLQKLFPKIKITVSKKADSLFPIVSAASICAKVIRDSLLSKWTFAETSLNDTASRDFGSGYPGDPTTKSWLRENMDPVFGFPGLIRFSWSTTANLLKEDGVQVKWPVCDEEDEEDHNKQHLRKRQSTLEFTKKAPCFKAYEDMQMALVQDFD